MYKLLIADDEQIVLDSTKYIIEKNFCDITVAATARSGREAVEKAESINPDIILMDIKMPGINGIDAIREIRRRREAVIFIILSAYEQFDYAKEAVEIGVMEYLLKPVSREKLIHALQKSVEHINIEREKRKKELLLKEKLQTVLPILENGFIYSIVFFEDNKEELLNYKNIFNIAEDSGYIVTVEFGQDEKTGRLGNRIGLSVKSESFYQYFRDMLQKKCKCYIGPVMLNRIIVFIPAIWNADEYSMRVDAVNIGEYIYECLANKVDADFYIGIGRVHRNFSSISRSYEESLRAIKFLKSKGLMHIMDIPLLAVGTENYPIAKETQLLERLSCGDSQGCLSVFNGLFEWMVCEYANDRIKVNQRVTELLVLVQRMYAHYNSDDCSGVFPQDYLKELQLIDNLEDLRILCRRILESVSKSIKYIRDKNVSKIILKSMQYIKENYAKEVSLEDTAKEANISPHYFCKLFKEETGENFIEYLTNIRIEKAKEMLRETDCSIKEICYEIGYGDPNYFSRIFRKVAGMTPTEYRETLID